MKCVQKFVLAREIFFHSSIFLCCYIMVVCVPSRIISVYVCSLFTPLSYIDHYFLFSNGDKMS